MKKESKFWLQVKNKIKDISFTRLESWASAEFFLKGIGA
jgi:hypothetical protein